MGTIPTAEKNWPDPMVFPDSEELREEFFTELDRAIGHSKKIEVWKLYPTQRRWGRGRLRA
jgi:hypothetical protein